MRDRSSKGLKVRTKQGRCSQGGSVMMRSHEVPTEEGCVCIPPMYTTKRCITPSFKTMRRLAHLHCQHTALLCTVMHWQEQTWLLHKNGLLQRLLCTLLDWSNNSNDLLIWDFVSVDNGAETSRVLCVALCVKKCFA